MRIGILGAFAFAGGLILASSAVRADDIEWNFNNQGVLAGNGCDTRAGDTFMTSAGDQFFITFTRMNLEMDSGPERTKTMNCRGRIPVRVQGNVTVERVTQTLSYSWSKTTGSSGGIYARNRWFGKPLSTLTRNFSANEQGSQPFVEVSTDSNFSWTCTSGWAVGSLDIDLGLSGLRKNPANEAISLNVAGEDFKYTAVAYARPGC